MKIYILDLTAAKLPKWWPSTHPKLIPVIKGKHQKDFDVAPKEMKKPWTDIHREILNNKHMKYNQALPIGFDLDEMPKGTILRVQ